MASGLQARNAQQASKKDSTPATLPPAAPVGLNRYIQDKFPKEYKGTGGYGEVVKLIEDFQQYGEKGSKLTHKYVVKSLLPRLSQYGFLTSNLLNVLLAFLYSSDPKLARYSYYLLQRLLGCGAAGTPIPALTGSETFLASAELSKKAVLKAWQDATRTDVSAITRQLQLKMLAAAARSYPDAVEDVASTVKQFLLDCGIDPKSKKASKTLMPKVDGMSRWVVLRAAYMATRTSLTGKPSTFNLICKRSTYGVDSYDAVGARHALALAANLTQTDPTTVEKELRQNVATALARNETMKSFDTVTAVKGQQALGVNLDDTYARVYLARICAAVLQLEKKDGENVFWRMLIAFATRDPSDYVALEAIKALAGGSVPQTIGLEFEDQHPNAESQANKRAKAWTILVRHADASVSSSAAKDKKGGKEEPTPPAQSKLLSSIRLRIKRALASYAKPSLVCAAGRAAIALAEARARASAGSMGRKAYSSASADKAITQLTDDLLAVFDGSSDPACRSLALTALIWLQVPNQPPVASAQRVYNNVVSCGHRGPAYDTVLDPWPQSCLEPVMRAVLQSAKACPALIQQKIEYGMALVHAAPSRVSHDALVEMWKLAVQSNQRAKNTAVACALQLITASPPPVASAASGASKESVIMAAAESAAWMQLQKLAAWWLGENSNSAANMFIGQEKKEDPHGAAPDSSKTSKAAATNAEHLALVASRSPMLVAVLDALHKALMAGPWSVRVGAAEAIAKIAVRSPEPYRLMCYSLLTSIIKPNGGLTRDSLGVLTVVQPALSVLDSIYTAQMEVEQKFKNYGSQAINWPEEDLQALRKKHEEVTKLIQKHIGTVPVGASYPLGPNAKIILTADPEKEKEELQQEMVKKNPDLWKEAADSDMSSEISDEEPAPWDMPQRSSPWDEERPPAPWEDSEKNPWDRAPAPWDRPAEEVNPWEEEEEKEERVALPWETKERPPWEKYATPDESSEEEEEEEPAFNRGFSYNSYDEPSTSNKDDFWDNVGQPAYETSAYSSYDNDNNYSSSFDAGSYQPEPSRYDYTMPEMSDEEEEEAVQTPIMRGIVRHEFVAENDDELTVRVDDVVDVLEEVDGWLLVADVSTGRKGLVPQTYVEDMSAGGGTAKPSHRREPTFSDNPWEDEDFSAQVEQPDISFRNEGEVLGAKGKHRREPTFGEYDADDDFAVEDALEPETSFKFEASPPKTEGEGQLGDTEVGDSRPETPTEDLKKLRAGVKAKVQMFEGVLKSEGSASSPRSQPLSDFGATSRGSSLAPAEPPVATSSQAVHMAELEEEEEEEELSYATVLFAFEGEDEEELTVTTGEKLLVHKEVDGWYEVSRQSDGAKGLVPCSYLQLD